MALALFDRVQETTTTTGTGSLTLDGAVSGFQSFAVVGDTNTCYYTIVDGSAWEVGIGTYSTGSTGATQTAGPTSGSWVTDGSLVGSNISWYSASDTGYAAGDYVLLFDQTAGSSFFYSGQITLIQFAGGFGFAFSANMLSSGGTPNGSPSSSWIMQETAVATTLARTTILSNSNADTSPITLTSGSKPVFLTYPAEKSVNLDASGNVSPLGTVSSGTWQGATVGVAYGGTGVTASSGANSVMLRDTNQNVSVNRLNQADTQTTAAGGITVLTAASTYSQSLKNTGSQTYKMPDATTLATGVAFIFNNNATGVLTLQDYAAGAIGTITSGGAAELVLLDNTTVAGTWDVHGFLPEAVTWGTNALALGTTVITGGTWNGGTIAPAYGGTGLTTFAGANNALYSTNASTLTAGTLPVVAGGTGLTSFTANGVVYASGTNTLTSGSALTFDGTNLGIGAAPTFYQGSGIYVTRSGFATIRLNDSSAGGTAAEIKQSDSTGLILESISNRPIQFNVNATEQMRLTSTGLGIGTSSPGAKLHVEGTSKFTDYIYGGAAGIVYFNADVSIPSTKKLYLDNGSNTYISEVASDTINFATGGTDRARIDSSGNLLVGTTISPTGTGKISTPTGYTAPDNAAGAGTTLNILGSTGTGQASATGGNGAVQIIGGGGTSSWTTFIGAVGGRRRGGILLQAGLAAVDAGATYYSGSTIDIRGSNGTNNGTLTGVGSSVNLIAGSVTKIDTFLNSGANIGIAGANSTSGGSVGVSSGSFSGASSFSGGSASMGVNGGSATGGGTASMTSGSCTGATFFNPGSSITVSAATATSSGSITLAINAVSAGSTRGRAIIDSCTVGSGAVSGNAILGLDALLSVTSGNQNVAIGQQASRNLTTGSANIAIGTNTLLAGVDSERNIAIGPYALTSLSSGYRNIAIGYDSARTTATGFENISIGAAAHYSLSFSYNSSVAVGTRALYSGGGSSNTALGHEAGFDLTSGFENVFVGRGSGQDANTNAYCVYVGARVASSIGSPIQEVVVAGTDATIRGKGSNTFFAYANSGAGVGGAYYNGANTTTWSTISDERIKTNFVPVTNGLAIVTALEPTEFNYIIGGKHEVGFKAQQYMTVLPEQVGKNAASPEEKKLVGEDEIYGITRNLDPYFVSAIKTLADQVEQLKAEINLLKGNSNA